MPKDLAKLRCSFCNKTAADVRKLIAGPAVFICDECVHACNQILDKEGDPPLPDVEPSRSAPAGAPKRRSIH